MPLLSTLTATRRSDELITPKVPLALRLAAMLLRGVVTLYARQARPLSFRASALPVADPLSLFPFPPAQLYFLEEDARAVVLRLQGSLAAAGPKHTLAVKPALAPQRAGRDDAEEEDLLNYLDYGEGFYGAPSQGGDRRAVFASFTAFFFSSHFFSFPHAPPFPPRLTRSLFAPDSQAMRELEAAEAEAREGGRRVRARGSTPDPFALDPFPAPSGSHNPSRSGSGLNHRGGDDDAAFPPVEEEEMFGALFRLSFSDKRSPFLSPSMRF